MSYTNLLHWEESTLQNTTILLIFIILHDSHLSILLLGDTMGVYYTHEITVPWSLIYGMLSKLESAPISSNWKCVVEDTISHDNRNSSYQFNSKLDPQRIIPNHNVGRKRDAGMVITFFIFNWLNRRRVLFCLFTV